MRIVGLTLCLLAVSAVSMAQGYRLDGAINDADDHTPLQGPTVKVTYQSDSTKWVLAETDSNGKFRVLHLPDGGYTVTIYFIGYNTSTFKTKIAGADKHLGSILLVKNPTTLKDVPIVAKENRVVQKADTTEYNANAYKVNTDASAEDLVTKMPGISSNNGTVTAHGETVQQVYVDGKEFFGQDATLALKNLPAEVIDKVQVFDKWSDQAQFTGFDDGNSQKAINITTKRGKSNGVFGKVYAGYGYIDDSKYSAGFGVNWFNGDRRISLIGLANNVNQQNFATQDLLGIIGTSTQRAGSGFSSGGGGRRGGGGGSTGGGGGNAGVNNFLIGAQPGISTTYSGGLNFQDTWGKKKNVKISASYFVNYQQNNTTTTLTRLYTAPNDTTPPSNYNETDNTNSRNINHRINIRLEYAIDTMNKIVFTPRLNFQQNNQTLLQTGQTMLGDILSSTSATQLSSANSGYNITGDLLYQHKFAKTHRTFSIDLSSTVNNKFSNQLQNSNTYYATTDDSSILNQQTNGTTTSYTVSANAAYTEPVGKNSILQFNYTPSNTWNLSDARTYNYDSSSESYDMLDTILSSKFSATYMTQKAGAAYRYGNKHINISVGVTGQYAILSGEENLPDELGISKTFLNALPNAMFSYKSDSGSSLRIFYRTSTSPPSITQLQNVVNNNNPLLLSSGNPNLKQSYTHSLLLRYGLTRRKKAQSLFAFLSASYTQNYVGNSSISAVQGDVMLANGLLLHQGSQFTQPVNLNGNINLNSFLTFGFPVDFMKSNMNLNGGFTYSSIPGLINGVTNLANTYNFNAGFVIGSNISEKIDFTISYTANYNLVDNTSQKSANNNYFNHTGSVKFNWLFWKGFVFNTNLQNTLYEGIAQGFNLDVFLWNAGLGYKFLKDKSLEVRASVNDILNQNTGINRTVTDTYVEDSKTQVLKRYMLLTVTYTMRYFKKT